MKLRGLIIGSILLAAVFNTDAGPVYAVIDDGVTYRSTNNSTCTSDSSDFGSSSSSTYLVSSSVFQYEDSDDFVSGGSAVCGPDENYAGVFYCQSSNASIPSKVSELLEIAGTSCACGCVQAPTYTVGNTTYYQNPPSCPAHEIPERAPEVVAGAPTTPYIAYTWYTGACVQAPSEMVMVPTETYYKYKAATEALSRSSSWVNIAPKGQPEICVAGTTSTFAGSTVAQSACKYFANQIKPTKKTKAHYVGEIILTKNSQGKWGIGWLGEEI